MSSSFAPGVSVGTEEVHAETPPLNNSLLLGLRTSDDSGDSTSVGAPAKRNIKQITI
jgi:hypothetical protein